MGDSKIISHWEMKNIVLENVHLNLLLLDIQIIFQYLYWNSFKNVHNELNKIHDEFSKKPLTPHPKKIFSMIFLDGIEI